MKFFTVILLTILAMPLGAFAQGVITGPFHKPVMVIQYGGGGSYSDALPVYSNKTTIAYTEDVTNNWSMVEVFNCSHELTTFMYFYNKQTEQTSAYLVSANLDKKTIVSRPGGTFGTPENYTFKSAPRILGVAVLDTMYIVDNEINARPSLYVCPATILERKCPGITPQQVTNMTSPDGIKGGSSVSEVPEDANGCPLSAAENREYLENRCPSLTSQQLDEMVKPDGIIYTLPGIKADRFGCPVK